MNCPKCGFVQEERVDCIKCGVVFAKFYALRASETPASLTPPEPPHGGTGFVEETHIPELTDLFEVRQGLRDLQQRFNDLEFERAERRQIRGDIRALEARIQENLARMATRQEEIDKQVNALASKPAAPTLQDLDALRLEVRAINAELLQKNLERIESRLLTHAEKLSAVTDTGFLELIPTLEGRLTALESRIAGLADGMATAHPEVDKAQLDDLRASLQNVTVRYAEIGGLKKNHLVLRDMIESLQQTTEGFRNEAVAGNSAKIAELEKEVLALRAEVRRAYQRVENLETTGLQIKQPLGLDPLKEISSLREELATAGRIRAAEHDRIQSEVGALQGKVSETLQTLTALPEKLESFSSQIRRLDQQYQPLTAGLAAVTGAIDGTPQMIADLSRDLTTLQEGFTQLQVRVQAMQEGLVPQAPSLADPGLPGKTDMTMIRDNLDEIRRFMTTLSQKIR